MRLERKTTTATITDASFTHLKTVPEGSAVSTSDLKAYVVSQVNTLWKESNIAEDTQYSMAFSKRVKEEILATYAEPPTWKQVFSGLTGKKVPELP